MASMASMAHDWIEVVNENHSARFQKQKLETDIEVGLKAARESLATSFAKSIGNLYTVSQKFKTWSCSSFSSSPNVTSNSVSASSSSSQSYNLSSSSSSLFSTKTPASTSTSLKETLELKKKKKEKEKEKEKEEEEYCMSYEDELQEKREKYISWIRSQLEQERDVYTRLFEKVESLFLDCKFSSYEPPEDCVVELESQMEILTELSETMRVNFNMLEDIILYMPVDLALKRIEEKWLNLENLKAGLRDLCFAEPKVLFACASRFGGPIVVSALLMAATGFLFSGIGIVVLVVSGIMGASWLCYHVKQKKAEQRRTNTAIEEMILQKQALYKRFLTVGEKIEFTDLSTLSKELVRGTDVFISLSFEIFHEIPFLCSICLEEDEKKEKEKETFQTECLGKTPLLPVTDVCRPSGCFHFFHFTCLNTWYSTCTKKGIQSSCPNCRKSFQTIVQDLKKGPV